MKRPQKLAVMLVPTPPYEICGLATGKVTPFGIYDLKLNTGFMAIGNSSETSEFAVNSIGMWWNWRGRYDYPGATQLLVLSDCGGGCSYRTHLFKQELQKLANRTGLTIRIAHYPPGCSKWNRIEHRLFSPYHPLATRYRI